MTDWRWVGLEAAYAIHDRQLAEHGGADGVRDRGLVESALARPRNLAAYEDLAHDDAGAARLAASYVHGLARNHGFVDGNKRTAWVIGRLFLADNGVRLRFEASDAVKIVEAVAAGVIEEDALARWFRARIG